MLKVKLAIYLQHRDRLIQSFSCLLSKLQDTRPFKWIINNNKRISSLLHVLWIAACGYFIYKVITADARAITSWNMRINDSREALVMIFFGIIASIFIFFLAFFILKLVYNLFIGGIEALFSMQWHPILKSISCLVLLLYAFSFTGNIKSIGLTAYNQFAGLVQTSRQHSLLIQKVSIDEMERKITSLLRVMEEEDEEYNDP